MGPHVKPGTLRRRLTHYSLLRTLEDGFGITRHLAHAARAGAITRIWRERQPRAFGRRATGWLCG
jgi:hypothetical protein